MQDLTRSCWILASDPIRSCKILPNQKPTFTRFSLDVENSLLHIFGKLLDGNT